MITSRDRIVLVDDNPDGLSISEDEFAAINKIQTWTHLDDDFWPVVLNDGTVEWDTGEGRPVCFKTGMEWMADGLYGVGEFDPTEGDDAEYLKKMRDTFLGIFDRLGIECNKELI